MKRLVFSHSAIFEQNEKLNLRILHEKPHLTRKKPPLGPKQKMKKLTTP